MHVRLCTHACTQAACVICPMFKPPSEWYPTMTRRLLHPVPSGGMVVVTPIAGVPVVVASVGQRAPRNRM
jgi:hypothetical protein